MKRFFCTACKKQVRVRQLPDGVQSILGPDGKVKSYTQGKCRWHSDSRPRTVLNNRVPSPRAAKPTKAPSTPPKKGK